MSPMSATFSGRESTWIMVQEIRKQVCLAEIVAVSAYVRFHRRTAGYLRELQYCRLWIEESPVLAG